MSVYIIDDAVDSRNLIRNILRVGGYDQIKEFASAIEAIEHIRTQLKQKTAVEIDCILLDIMMPDMNGLEALKKLRKIPELTVVPILMITADTHDTSLQKAFDSGADDYVKKPFTKIELLSRIRSVLKRKELLERQHEIQHHLESSNQSLRKASILDPLTGIANRRRFDDVLATEWNRCMRTRHSLSLLMCDIDHFKNYNDTYGHVEGDNCLKAVAGCISNQVNRSGELVARFGGEEFAVILPNCSLEQSMALAENIRIAVEQTLIPVHHPDKTTSVTLSVGVACIIPDTNFTSRQLIRTADKALYEAKSKGRNQCVSSPSLSD